MKDRKRTVPDKTECPYFEVGSVELVLAAPFKSRRIPTPVCHLSEVMLSRLRTTADGAGTANLLTLTPGLAPPRCMYGPDLDPPVREACTLARLQRGCEAGFIQLLTQYALRLDLPALPVLSPETETP